MRIPLKRAEIDLLLAELEMIYRRRELRFAIAMGIFSLGFILLAFLYNGLKHQYVSGWLVAFFFFVGILSVSWLKVMIKEPQELKDKLVQERLWGFCLTAANKFVLVLRPSRPKAYSFSGGLHYGSGLSGLPHPLAQPDQIYMHGYDIYRGLEAMSSRQLVFVCVGGLEHMHAEYSVLARTLFLNTKDEYWERVVEILMSYSSKVIFVPEISDGMSREFNMLHQKNKLNSTFFFVPRSSNPRLDLKKAARGWKDIRDKFLEVDIRLPERYDHDKDQFFLTTSGDAQEVDVERELASALDAPGGQIMDALGTLNREDLLLIDHFSSLRARPFFQKLAAQLQIEL